MRYLRVLVLSLRLSSLSLAANKDLIELQRQLNARLDTMEQDQRNLASKVDVLTGALTTIQNDSRRTADQVATMQEAISSTVSRALAPATNLNTRVDSVGEDVRSLRDGLADLSARLERMDAKITDLKNQMQIMQSPPPAPGAGGVAQPGGTGVPGQSGAQQGPPPGMSAEKAYTDARRDQQTGNLDLAYQEYQQYLTYFPNT